MFNFFSKLKGITLEAPITGQIKSLSEVPDPVFAEKMVGDGIAIEIEESTVVAPCDGKIVQIFPTHHAVGIEAKGGIDLLIHVGIDTVNLQGEGFKCLVNEGDEVKKGTPLLEVDIEKVKAAGKSLVSPFIITNMDDVEIKDMASGKAQAGVTKVLTVKKNK